MLKVDDKVLRKGFFTPVYTVKSVNTWLKIGKKEIELEEIKGVFPINDFIKYKHENTPEFITQLKPNEIFVFGSNVDGLHGAGAARIAVEKFGAIYGQARGLQGQSYAIPTVDLKDKEAFTIENLEKEIFHFLVFALSQDSKKFYLTKIGTGLAHFTIEQVKEILSKYEIPSNVVLPKEFEDEKN